MANETVLFKRGDSATITSTPVTDGQILFDTSGNGKMYLDNGTDRLEMGGAITVDASLSKTSTNAIQNKAVTGNILNSLAEVSAATQQNTIAGALALKEVNESLTFPDGTTFYPDIQDGKYGFNTDPNRGADTFIPFSNGNYYYRAFKGSDPVENRKDTLKVNTGVFFAYYNGEEFGRYELGFAFCVKDGTVIVNRTQGSDNFKFSYSNGTLSLYSNERGYKCYGFYN